MDFSNFLEKARQMQANLQEEMVHLEVEADSGGGMVKARMNGKKELLALTIDPEVLRDNDLDMIQDLIIAAINQCSRKVDFALSSKLGNIASQFNIPGLG